MRSVSDFNGECQGEPVYVVGCGPTLCRWPRLWFKNRTCIFISSAIHYPAHFARPSWYRIMMDRACVLHEYGYGRGFPEIRPRHPEVPTFLTRKVWEKMPPEERGLLEGVPLTLCDGEWPDCFAAPLEGDLLWRPTTWGAVSLAVRMGASHVHLIGVDHGSVGGRTHWDNKLGPQPSATQIKKLDRWCGFQRSRMVVSVIPDLKRRGIQLTRWAAPGQEIGLIDRPEP